MPLKLTINGLNVSLPTDKPWSLTYAPDVVVPKPPDGIVEVAKPVTDIAVAIANAKPGDTIPLGGHYSGVKSIKVTTAGLSLVVVSPTYIEFDPQGEKDAALFVLQGITGFTASGLTVSGPADSSHASYIVRCENASAVKLSHLKTVYSPAGGMGIVFCRGVNGLDVDDCSTERTTVYSMYCSAPSGQLVNQNINVRRCSWGKSDSHNMRVYGVKNLLIDLCIFSNPRSPSGRQCLKVMNGENVSIKRISFDGTTRFGRDVNDPDTYTLKNCVIEDCGFSDWTRVDPTGGNVVTYRRCDVKTQGDSFVFHLFDKTALENVSAEYPDNGGALASNSKYLVSATGVTFNGKAWAK